MPRYQVETTSKEQEIALHNILFERQAQDEQWGGPVHDDTHVFQEWKDLIAKFLARFDDRTYSKYSLLRKIAALSLAAMESSIRKDKLSQLTSMARVMESKIDVTDLLSLLKLTDWDYEKAYKILEFKRKLEKE